MNEFFQYCIQYWWAIIIGGYLLVRFVQWLGWLLDRTGGSGWRRGQ